MVVPITLLRKARIILHSKTSVRWMLTHQRWRLILSGTRADSQIDTSLHRDLELRRGRRRGNFSRNQLELSNPNSFLKRQRRMWMKWLTILKRRGKREKTPKERMLERKGSKHLIIIKCSRILKSATISST